ASTKPEASAEINQRVAMATSQTLTLSCPMGVNHCLRLVAGADLSFVKGDSETACASLVVLSLPNLSPVHKICRQVKVSHPYVLGFLSFREAPPLLELLDELRATKPELMPQALLLDGNGTLHPRGFGLACHVGVLAGLPTVGAAKSFFHVDGLDQKQVRKLVKEAGNRDYYIKGESGAVIGCAHVPDVSVKNPVYISCGHMISLSTAVWLVGHCCRYRVPEPTRLADFESREFLRQESAASKT
uniref:Endonuclease V n=1 Tax=Macrostomum lignano TaxID=282301 RepID=A0A1I8H644_9PLAT